MFAVLVIAIAHGRRAGRRVRRPRAAAPPRERCAGAARAALGRETCSRGATARYHPPAARSREGNSGDLVARVTPGRPARRVGGIIGLALGGAGLGTAAFLYWSAKRNADLDNDLRGDTAPRVDPKYTPATALLISGAIVAAGGLVMLLLSGTRVSWSTRTAAARRRLGLG